MSKLNSLFMSRPATLLAPLLVAATLLAVPAAGKALLAESRASALWADWQEQFAATGQSFTTDSVVSTGDGLVIRGFATSMTITDVPGYEFRLTGHIDRITLTEQDDGTIRVTPSDMYRITGAGRGPEGVTTQITGDITHEGLDILVLDTGDGWRYDYAADLRRLTAVSRGSPAEELLMVIEASDMAGQVLLTESGQGAPRFTGSSAFGGLTGMADLNAQTEELTMTFNVGPARVRSGGSGPGNPFLNLFLFHVPDVRDDAHLHDAGEITYESLEYAVTIREAGREAGQNATTIRGANGGGRMALGLEGGAGAFDLSARDVAISVVAPEFPLPVTVTAESAGVLLTMPLTPARGPSDGALRLEYQGVKMGAAAWDMFDPGRVLPRDPATLILDVTGTVQGPADDLRTLTLNDLEIAVAGATLTGKGALDFAPGQQMPAGSIQLQATGLHTLLDRLTGAGLVPMEQAVGLRAMAGIFARPGTRPDTLETVLDFWHDGGVTVNGIPLP
ncbi:MAG: DUF2125 domain-containing protein [Rhodobacteraceae bacterium]|nr:DUF2125 domain-containing protein [Paracoccaceae bacterium]